MSHHWVYNGSFGDESEEAENNAVTHICKHCEVVGNECGECDGDGYSRKASLGDEPCAGCDGEGVVVVGRGE
jgi:hypothetical protein